MTTREVERASLCNLVINFLLEEGYLLTAFELLHDLAEDGHADRATRLHQFFADTHTFPPHQLLHMQTLDVANPQRVVEERDAAEERAAILEYELRLAQEDLKCLQEKLEKSDSAPLPDQVEKHSSFGSETATVDVKQRDFKDLGPLRESEKIILNSAVKEFLFTAGYKLTAMTFHEEVNDQDLDNSNTGPVCVPDALRRYYLHFQSACPDAIEEKALLEVERNGLQTDKETLLHEKKLLENQIANLEQENSFLSISLQAVQKDVQERDRQIHLLKESLEQASKDLNDCRIEITSLKLELQSSKASKQLDGDMHQISPPSGLEELKSYKTEIDMLKAQLELAKAKASDDNFLDIPVEEKQNEPGVSCYEDIAVEFHEDIQSSYDPHRSTVDDTASDHLEKIYINDGTTDAFIEISTMNHLQSEREDAVASRKLGNGERQGNGRVTEDIKEDLKTVEILADSLPKIAPFVLINHREELLPLMMCAIERHPESSVRDLLTHTLFNLIKRPDENQRRIIMDACLSLSKNIGEERTELELLPQCWEQINHKYEERRLLVAQSCGELAKFVKPDMRPSLILSIVQQLVEDPAAVVRDAAAHNLALLLPLFPDTEKYFKVEEIMFQLVCDPSGMVVERTLKELVPSLINWAKLEDRPLNPLLRSLLSHLLGTAQRSPPVSGVEGSVEAQLRVLGERERWNVDALLQMLAEVLHEVRDVVNMTCPYSEFTLPSTNSPQLMNDSSLSQGLLETHFRENKEWYAFDWMHFDCLPSVLQLACMLPSWEDTLRTRLSKLLLTITKYFGNQYLSLIMLPFFLTAVGDDVDISHLSSGLAPRIKGLKPKTSTDQRLAVMCILPLLLAGVLGAPSMREELVQYLRELVLQHSIKHGAWTSTHTPELMDAVRFLCTFEEQHGVIAGVLWELVVNTNADVKISAASLLKVLVSYIDMKFATQQVLPALVTLGTDPNLNVKHSSIDAFGAVAQRFNDDAIIEKIRVQMDAFLEDGSHEATVAVIHALTVAVPLTTSRLREYLLQKLLLLTAATTQSTTLVRRRQRADAFCEAIRALDASELPPSAVKEQLLPAIQNLLKDPDALDPAHKEALEIIFKERSGGRLDAITKVMGTHLSMSGVTSLFGETGFLGKKDTPEPESFAPQAPLQEEGRLMRMMRGNFGERLRGKREGD